MRTTASSARRRGGWAAGAALVLAGCLSGPGHAGPGTVLEEGETMQSDSTLPAVARQARELLAERLQVASVDVRVVEVTEVTWSDTSIGCPQPGMAYAQKLVNGTRVLLEFGGREYHYHAGGGRGPFYCADPQAPASGAYGDA